MRIVPLSISLQKKPTESLPEAFALSKALTKKFGTSYYLAMKLFPERIRMSVYALYAFVRTADEIVDTEEKDSAKAEKKLMEWRAAWKTALETSTSTDPVLYGAAWTFKNFLVPPELMDDFLDAMVSDTHVSRYADYAALEHYMYGSAAVIGRIMTHIIGTSSEKAFQYAEDLGYAMQLTNFLRDVGEDYEERGRIYLPQTDMNEYGVTEDMIAHGEITQQFCALMQFEIARARALYARADLGIPMLHPEGQKAVRLARVFYSKILDQIEAAGYNVFTNRARTTKLQKLRLALPILFS